MFISSAAHTRTGQAVQLPLLTACKPLILLLSLPEPIKQAVVLSLISRACVPRLTNTLRHLPLLHLITRGDDL